VAGLGVFWFRFEPELSRSSQGDHLQKAQPIPQKFVIQKIPVFLHFSKIASRVRLSNCNYWGGIHYKISHSREPAMLLFAAKN
jgi:hypothetical protein